ncbi:MAG: DEAD/DEAH box helicase [Armatimonadia bacterium]
MPELSKNLAAVVTRLPSRLPPPVRVVEPDVGPPVAPIAPPQKLPIPKLNAGVVPTDIQRKFADFIEKHQGVGIAAHRVGQGKTLAGIMASLRLREKGMGGSALAVVPAALRENFATKGVKKFTNASVGVIGTADEIAKNRDMDVSAMGRRDFYVISYDMFKKDPEKYLKATGADTVITDELHRAKDEDTEIHKTIERIRPSIKNFIGLTATPAMNNPFEMVSLINAISKKKMTPGEFQKEFYERKADGFKDWFFGLFGHEKHGPIEGVKNPSALGRFIGANYHFAPAVVDPSMPKKKVEVVKVPMSEAQTKLYKAVLQKQLTFRERRILERGDLLDDKVLAPIINKTMAARQLSNNAGFVTGELEPLKTPKILSALTDIETELEKNPRGQVVVYSQFMDNGVEVMARALEEAKIPFGLYTGRNQAERDTVKNDYNAGKIKVLLISGAGSEGLDLPNTTMLSMLDGSYNPEMITQIEGRGVRRGGLAYLPAEKRVVKIKRYVSVPEDDSMSVDEKIYDIAAKKAELVKMFQRAAESFQRKQEARAAQAATKKPRGHD